jgi:hypothetical protein
MMHIGNPHELSGRLTIMATGLFLGAGASFECGMPLVWDLTAEIGAWLTSEKLKDLNCHWRAHSLGYPRRGDK